MPDEIYGLAIALLTLSIADDWETWDDIVRRLPHEDLLSIIAVMCGLLQGYTEASDDDPAEAVRAMALNLAVLTDEG